MEKIEIKKGNEEAVLICGRCGNKRVASRDYGFTLCRSCLATVEKQVEIEAKRKCETSDQKK